MGVVLFHIYGGFVLNLRCSFASNLWYSFVSDLWCWRSFVSDLSCSFASDLWCSAGTKQNNKTSNNKLED